jgi:hypothetical protein
MAYLLVTGTDWSRRPEYASSFPSWSCGFDSRRPLRKLHFIVILELYSGYADRQGRPSEFRLTSGARTSVVAYPDSGTSLAGVLVLGAFPLHRNHS